MLQHLLSGGSVTWVPFENLHKEIRQHFCLLGFHLVPINEQFVQGQSFEIVDSSKVPLLVSWVLVEVVVEHVALLSELFGARTKHFHELSQVVIVLLEGGSWSWVEEEVASDQLEDHASE